MCLSYVSSFLILSLRGRNIYSTVSSFVLDLFLNIYAVMQIYTAFKPEAHNDGLWLLREILPQEPM